MKPIKIILIVLGFLIAMIGISYGTGWIGVHQTKTIGKAKKDAEREVFENSKSFVESKKQAALKYYKEYNQATEEQKKGLAYIISQEFSNFDEDKYLTGEIKYFIRKCKYGK